MELGLNATDKTNIQKDGLWEDGREMAIRKCFIKEKKITDDLERIRNYIKMNLTRCWWLHDTYIWFMSVWILWHEMCVHWTIKASKRDATNKSLVLKCTQSTKKNGTWKKRRKKRGLNEKKMTKKKKSDFEREKNERRRRELVHFISISIIWKIESHVNIHRDVEEASKKPKCKKKMPKITSKQWVCWMKLDYDDSTSDSTIHTIDDDKIKWLMTIYERNDRQLTISSTHFLVLLCCCRVSFAFVYCLVMNMKPQFVDHILMNIKWAIVCTLCAVHGIESQPDWIVLMLVASCFACAPFPNQVASFGLLVFVVSRYIYIYTHYYFGLLWFSLCVQCALCVHSYNKFILFLCIYDNNETKDYMFVSFFSILFLFGIY